MSIATQTVTTGGRDAEGVEALKGDEIREAIIDNWHRSSGRQICILSSSPHTTSVASRGLGRAPGKMNWDPCRKARGHSPSVLDFSWLLRNLCPFPVLLLSMIMQRATITGIRVRSPSDARIIFHSVFLNIFPMVTRRLDTEERGLITSGSVYVWEERGPQAELTGVGIERWTDGIRWGPSRVREGFLFYHEKTSSQQIYTDSFHSASYDPSRSVLIKQTYTVYVDTAHGRRKWHLIAYFTEDTASRLKTVDDIPQLASLVVPHGRYKSARSAKGRPDSIFNNESEGSGFSRLEYVPYMPRPSPPTPIPDLTLESSEAWQNKLVREQSVPRPSGPSSTTSSDENVSNALVPLCYLQDQPLVRREPTDQILLKKLDSYYDRQDRPTVLTPRFAC